MARTAAAPAIGEPVLMPVAPASAMAPAIAMSRGRQPAPVAMKAAGASWRVRPVSRGCNAVTMVPASPVRARRGARFRRSQRDRPCPQIIVSP
jgi:hypothetical protein